MAPTLYVGKSGNGALNQMGGSLSISGTAWFALDIGGTGESPGTWTQTGGTCTISDSAYLHLQIGNASSGTLTVNDPDAVMNLGAGAYLYLGNSPGVTGVLNLGSGSINHTGGAWELGCGGPGVVNVTGGTLNFNAPGSPIWAGWTSAGSMTVNGSAAVVNINSSVFLFGNGAAGSARTRQWHDQLDGGQFHLGPQLRRRVQSDGRQHECRHPDHSGRQRRRQWCADAERRHFHLPGRMVIGGGGPGSLTVSGSTRG